MAEAKLTAADKKLLAQEAEKEEMEKRQAENRAVFFQLFQKMPQFSLLNEMLKKDSLFHAYFFSGPENSLKKEAAMLFAASILTRSRSLLNEAKADPSLRDTAAAIYRGDYGDFIFLDGSRKEAIKKEEIDSLQQRFSRTASGGFGRKVYVIHRFENTSIGAMNSLLKFLEEPSSEVYAILTADNAERVLETIRSRCICIPFQPLSARVISEFIEKAGVDEEDAPLLSCIVKDLSAIPDTAASASFQAAKHMFQQYAEGGRERRLLYVDYESRYRAKAGSDTSEGVKQKDARDQNVDTLDYFFSFLLKFFMDALSYDGGTTSWYHRAVSAEKVQNTRRQLTEKVKIAGESRDRVNRNNDLSLLLAQALFRLEECTND